MSTQAILSEAEFDAMARAEGNTYELSEGEVIVTASPRMFHNLVRDRLGESLAAYARTRQLGSVVWENDFRLTAATVRVPDLAFVRRERMQSLNVRERPEGAPDLAIEVVSPSNDPNDLVLKAEQFLRAGAAVVWIIYPDARFVHVYQSGRDIEVRRDGQLLDAPALLPGWSIPLTELFDAARP